GTVFAATIWLAKTAAREKALDEADRTGAPDRARARRVDLGGIAGYAVFYAMVVSLMSYVVVHAAPIPALLALSALTGTYQATWFTAAWILGAQFSTRAAVIATTLEGAVGFSAFIVFRMLHG